MKVKAKEPPVPMERFDTVRHRIISLLLAQPGSARQISAELRISEREAYDHLEHIRRSMHKGAYQLVIRPALCERCGFTFRKRNRLKKPGRCPICRSESIAEPLFTVLKAD